MPTWTKLLGIAGVVVVQTIRPEGVEDLVANHAPHLVIVHAAMQRGSDDDVDVIDAVIGEHRQHDVEDGLADVGRTIGGSGSEMSSTAIVTFMPGSKSACSGSIDSGWCSA